MFLDIVRQAEEIAAAASAPPRPSQAEQIKRFGQLGQVLRELPLLARGSGGWRRAETRRQALETKIAGWREECGGR